MSGTKNKRLDWHPEAITELAESLAWYAKRNPTAAKRMRNIIEEAAHSLIASPIAVSGRLGVVAGTRELPVGHRVPFTLIFVRHCANWYSLAPVNDNFNSHNTPFISPLNRHQCQPGKRFHYILLCEANHQAALPCSGITFAPASIESR